MENFVKTELLKRVTEKCNREKIVLNDTIKSLFFGTFFMDESNFHFDDDERSLILSMPEALKRIDLLDNDIQMKIIQDSKKVGTWFEESIKIAVKPKSRAISAPVGAENLLCKMLEAAEINSKRPKQGYRYKKDLKRLAVYNRTLAGPMAYKSLQLNLKGCFPSISTTNRYIHRTDHAIFEGVLRCHELMNYLKERKLPIWVSLSEDATRVENRIQYDSRSVQIVGFVLPTNVNTGMPIPFSYKGGSASEILQHFSKKIPIAHYINTVMAQPLAHAPPFCLLVFGSDNKYKAEDVAKRWIYISEELAKIGIGVLTVSSDSDSKYNAAMRINSGLGRDSNEYSMNGLFKCNPHSLPFYVQDYPHIGTKLRNLILKTTNNPFILPMGKYFVRREHLDQLMKLCRKDEHLLTATVLNPNDRQNFDSVLKMCNSRVLQLLKEKVIHNKLCCCFANFNYRIHFYIFI